MSTRTQPIKVGELDLFQVKASNEYYRYLTSEGISIEVNDEMPDKMVINFDLSSTAKRGVIGAKDELEDFILKIDSFQMMEIEDQYVYKKLQSFVTARKTHARAEKLIAFKMGKSNTLRAFPVKLSSKSKGKVVFTRQ